MSLFDKYTYIVASCRKEAEQYADAYGVPKNRFFFVDSLANVRGIPRDSTVWLCGQYQDLKGWEGIEKELKARGVTPTRRL